MDEQMNGVMNRTNEWMDGQMNRWWNNGLNEWMGGWKIEWRWKSWNNGLMKEQINGGWVDGQMNGDGKMDWWTACRWMDCTDRWNGNGDRMMN